MATLANLKANTDGSAHRGKGGRFYLGIAYRKAFTVEDMERFAQVLKDIAFNPEEKTADRLKATDLALRKLVADEMPEQEETQIKDVNDFKSLLAQLVNSTAGLSEVSQG